MIVPRGRGEQTVNEPDNAVSQRRARRWRAAEAAFLLPLCSIGVRLLGVTRTQRWLGLCARAVESTDRVDDPAEVVRTVDKTSRRLRISFSCVPRSLSIWTMLRRRRVDSSVRLGVRRVAGAVEAHAWVEASGRVLDSADPTLDFTPFTRPL